MTTIIDKLLADGPIITDGAWGTQLQQLGLPVGHSPDGWNLEAPEKVQQVPRAYVEAGSNVVLTNTFRANRLALEGDGLADQVVEINRAGAEISLQAAAGEASVFASIGPSGKMLLSGETTEDQLREIFEEQASALADAGVDAIVIETMADLAEAKIALAAAKQTGLPVVCCMVFDSGKDLDRTMMGNTVEQVAKELTDAGADVIGANCGQGIVTYIEICKRYAAATDLPLWIKPNAGIPQMEGDRVVYDSTAEDFAESGQLLVEAGASFVGGCCGTGPEFIRALKNKLS